ncbi:MAG: hypothetical protein HY072_02180 [Deltaproteobacteria bacterium]|nr:hypothetical protein [Deltaproteobacteria bacterium]
MDNTSYKYDVKDGKLVTTASDYSELEIKVISFNNGELKFEFPKSNNLLTTAIAGEYTLQKLTDSEINEILGSFITDPAKDPDNIVRSFR